MSLTKLPEAWERVACDPKLISDQLSPGRFSVVLLLFSLFLNDIIIYQSENTMKFSDKTWYLVPENIVLENRYVQLITFQLLL